MLVNLDPASNIAHSSKAFDIKLFSVPPPSTIYTCKFPFTSVILHILDVNIYMNLRFIKIVFLKDIKIA